MASDRNLINAAFAEAKSRYAGNFPDLTNLYKSSTDISKQYLKTMGGIMEEIQKEREVERKKIKQQKNAFMNIANKNLQSLYENEEPLPEAMISMAESAVEDMAAQFDLVNTIGDDDTKENQRAKRQILAKLKKLTNQLKDVRKNYMDRSDIIQKDILSNKVYKEKNIELIATAFDLKNMDKNVFDKKIEVGYDIDDGVYFNVLDENGEFQNILFTDVASAFNPRNTSLDDEYIKTLNASGRRGELDGKDINATMNYDENSFLAGFKNLIKDEQDFDDFAYDRITNLNDEPSFEESVYENAITMGIPFAVLDQMMIVKDDKQELVGEKYKELDLVPDGVINSLDGKRAEEIFKGQDLENFKENVKQLIDAVVNKDNPAFNFEVSRDLMAKYYMTFDKRNYMVNFQQHRSILENRNRSRNNTSGPGSMSIGGMRYGSLKELLADHKTMLDFIENPEEVEEFQDTKKKNSYQYRDGKYYGADGDGNYTVDLSTKADPTGRTRVIQDQQAGAYVSYSQGKYHSKGNNRYSAVDLNMNERIYDGSVSQPRVGDFLNMDLQEAVRQLNSSYETNLFKVNDQKVQISDKTFRINSKKSLSEFWRYLTSKTFADYYNQNN